MATSTYLINSPETGGIRVEHFLTLTKISERQLGTPRINKQVEAILAGVNNVARTKRGWSVSVHRGHEQDYLYDTAATGIYRNTVQLAAICTPEKPRDSLATEFQNILNSLASLGTVPKWKITDVDGKPYTVQAPEQMAEGMADQVGYAPFVMPDLWEENFGHLFGLDAHINRIQGALLAAEQSNWNNRFHCALIGPPGCGKSDICQSIKRALGEESVLEFDATSTTMVGAQKDLTDREELPRVMLIEEVEKADEKSLQWLLSVLDIRAEVRRITARSTMLRDTKMLAVATINNYDLFMHAMSGALASRFSNLIYFQRPPRDLLHRIVLREVLKVRGDERWIAPALDYADQHQVGDPRALIALTLCGRERLLTGEYQKDLEATAMVGGWQ